MLSVIVVLLVMGHELDAFRGLSCVPACATFDENMSLNCQKAVNCGEPSRRPFEKKFCRRMDMGTV
jgi:hypothetical protein